MEKIEIIESILSDDSKVYDVLIRIQDKTMTLCCTDRNHADKMAHNLGDILDSAVHISIS